jgi:hypothetical protein
LYSLHRFWMGAYLRISSLWHGIARRLGEDCERLLFTMGKTCNDTSVDFDGLRMYDSLSIIRYLMTANSSYYGY